MPRDFNCLVARMQAGTDAGTIRICLVRYQIQNFRSFVEKYPESDLVLSFFLSLFSSDYLSPTFLFSDFIARNAISLSLSLSFFPLRWCADKFGSHLEMGIKARNRQREKGF